MPEVGGKALAGSFRDKLQGLRKQMDDVALDVAAAMTELQSEIATGPQIAKQLRAEAAEVRAAFGEVLGNAPPADQTADKPQDGQS